MTLFRKYPFFRTAVLDIEKPPEEQNIVDHTFDVVVSNRVLEHLPPLQETLVKVARWLKPGGALLISGPLEHTTRSKLWRYANELRRHSPTPIAEPPYHVHEEPIWTKDANLITWLKRF